MRNKSEKSQKLHVAASASGAILTLVAYIYFTSITNSLPAEDANSFLSLWSPILLGVLLTCVAYSVFAVFKVNGWLKSVPIICIVVNLLLFAIVAFFYVFGKMFSSSH